MGATVPAFTQTPQTPQPAGDRQVDALQLFLDHPNITREAWCKATGMSERSYYEYKRTAYPRHATEPQQTDTTAAAPRRKSVVAAQPQTDTAGTAIVHSQHRNKILYAIFLAATVASAENMYNTISQFAPDTLSALALTIVFALTAIGITAAGIQHGRTVYLIGALVAFEAFCNCINIYGGLYDFAANAGTAFLMRVQSLLWFISPKDCATILAVFAAGCIAAVQYTAIKEIRQPQRKIAVRTTTEQ